MQFSTLARDCLYVNWALPKKSVPELPPTLHYESHVWEGDDWVFASVLLFRLSGLHLESMPFARVSYPQMNLRLYVHDDDGVPSVLFLRTLVPFWIAPMSRFLGRQPATAASFSFPSPSDRPEDEGWVWIVERRRKLEIWGRLASPQVGRGPRLGSWEQTVKFFRNRRRGYAVTDDRLRAVRTSHSTVAIWPLEVEIEEVGLVSECLVDVATDCWSRPHSAWLCPEIPFHVELGKPISLPLPSGGIPATEWMSSTLPSDP